MLCTFPTFHLILCHVLLLVPPRYLQKTLNVAFLITFHRHRDSTVMDEGMCRLYGNCSQDVVQNMKAHDTAQAEANLEALVTLAVMELQFMHSCNVNWDVKAISAGLSDRCRQVNQATIIKRKMRMMVTMKKRKTMMVATAMMMQISTRQIC